MSRQPSPDLSSRAGATTDEAEAILRARIPGYAEARLTPLEEIANQVILARTMRGYTQAELAELCKTSKPAISRLESGRHLPDLVTLDTLARVLEIEISLPLKSGPLAQLRPRQKKTESAQRRPSQPSLGRAAAPMPMYASAAKHRG